MKNDEEMAELMKSIADSGVLAPALARPKDGGGYELISTTDGLPPAKHWEWRRCPLSSVIRRTKKLLSRWWTVTCKRSISLPSEKAFAYKMKMEAMKRQGKRTDLTSSQVATKLDAATEIGKHAGESRIKYSDISA